jgi:hypothetical protein
VQNTVESYWIRVYLVIGLALSEPDRNRSFELYRSGSVGVEIVTFDGLLTRVKLLRNFLEGTDGLVLDTRFRALSRALRRVCLPPRAIIKGRRGKCRT